MKVKDKLHNLIDQIEDDAELESYLYLLSLLSNRKEGLLASRLSESQKESLEISYKESLNPSNLIDHDQVKAKYNKWL